MKEFLFKSSSILSVAILLASLTTIGSANAQEMQKKQVKLPTPIIINYKEDYFGLIRKANYTWKKKKVLFPFVLQVKKEHKVRVTPKTTIKPVIRRIIKTVIKTPVRASVTPVQTPQKKISIIATAYTNTCYGCSGITSTGINVKNGVTYDGMTIIATDPNIIPLHSKVRIDTQSGQSFIAVAEDEGGAIHGHIVDVLVSSYSQAINFGRQKATITILREGA